MSTTQYSQADDSSEPIIPERPWIAYIMAAWSLMGLNTLLSIAASDSLNTSYATGKLAGFFVWVFSIFMFVFILQMRKRAIVTFGLICVGMSLWQLQYLIPALFENDIDVYLIILLLYYIIPSVTLAWFALTPAFLKKASEYRDVKLENARKITSMKELQHQEQAREKEKQKYHPKYASLLKEALGETGQVSSHITNYNKDKEREFDLTISVRGNSYVLVVQERTNGKLVSDFKHEFNDLMDVVEHVEVNTLFRVNDL